MDAQFRINCLLAMEELRMAPMEELSFRWEIYLFIFNWVKLILKGAVIITNGMDGAVGLIPNVIVNNTTNDNSANVETGPKNVEAIEAKPHEVQIDFFY